VLDDTLPVVRVVGAVVVGMVVVGVDRTLLGLAFMTPVGEAFIDP
jgi:hypothetical protein